MKVTFHKHFVKNFDKRIKPRVLHSIKTSYQKMINFSRNPMKNNHAGKQKHDMRKPNITRKEMKDVPLKYEEIRKKFGEMPVVGKQTKNRIVEVLKNNTDLDHKKVDEIIGSILKHFKLNN